MEKGGVTQFIRNSIDCFLKSGAWNTS